MGESGNIFAMDDDDRDVMGKYGIVSHGRYFISDVVQLGYYRFELPPQYFRNLSWCGVRTIPYL